MTHPHGILVILFLNINTTTTTNNNNNKNHLQSAVSPGSSSSSSSIYFNSTTSISQYSNECIQYRHNGKLNTFLEKGKHNINVGGCTMYLVHYNFTYCTVWYSLGHLARLTARPVNYFYINYYIKKEEEKKRAWKKCRAIWC